IHDLLKEVMHILFARDVTCYRKRWLSRACDVCRDFIQGCGCATEEYDLCPFAGKAQGGGTPYTTTCSGYDGDTIFDAHNSDYSTGFRIFHATLSSGLLSDLTVFDLYHFEFLSSPIFTGFRSVLLSTLLSCGQSFFPVLRLF